MIPNTDSTSKPNKAIPSWFQRTKDRFYKAYKRFLAIEGEPHHIALGFALGLFVGMTPTMGFQMAIAVFFAIPLKWNKLSAAAGVWITNPLTAPFIYWFNYVVGKKVFHIHIVQKCIGDPSTRSFLDLIQETPDILIAMTLGGLVLGLPLAVLGYYVSYALISRYQKRKKHADDPSAESIS
jgi:hypothetical protein